MPRVENNRSEVRGQDNFRRPGRRLQQLLELIFRGRRSHGLRIHRAETIMRYPENVPV